MPEEHEPTEERVIRYMVILCMLVALVQKQPDALDESNQFPLLLSHLPLFLSLVS